MIEREQGTGAARGFGLARSTRYPFPPTESRVLSTPVLASIRKRVPPLRGPKRERARARARHVSPLPRLYPHPALGLAGDDRDYEPLYVDSFRSPTRLPHQAAGQ